MVPWCHHSATHDDGSCNVAYDDGDFEASVPASYLKAGSSAAAETGRLGARHLGRVKGSKESAEEDSHIDGEWQLGSSVEAQDARGTWYDATVVEERGVGASRELR